MFDNVVRIGYVLLMLLVTVGTVAEWRRSRRHLQLLPIAAYGLSALTFIGPLREGQLHPWLAAFAWLAVGILIRVIAKRQDQPD